MDQTTFDFIPLSIDPQTKAISSSSASSSAPSSRALAAEIAELNNLSRALVTLVENPMGVPPPPIPVNPKRSAGVTKLREAANAEFRKGRYEEAGKLYTMGLQMALSRPPWERSQVVRDEVSNLFSNRAQTCMALKRWAEGGVDAEASVEAKRVGNAKAWWRRGRCLLEMGRLEEAREWVGRALELEGEEGELVVLLRDIEERLRKEKA
ncbi:related to translocation protein [Cephalotrichum gorgonifer]|uniref:Related to translocation protein n=1 Tax=Cephalotrichum gorgonifer TaxID=2041049 RepID=A0AAE8SRY7_9PEZI|nr:related to translocation protein [Cephalotrichum gorgonifer]